ncbi:MAG: ABC transporter ATP-binding protein [Butyrivibrio sp.]|nr:ABC transporter ATP-binding protein [Butyrivibrio sp.]
MDNLLEIKGLTKNYKKIKALDNIDLTLEPGHITGLLGPNGSGKTTMIKIICGLLRPTSGIVSVNGNPIGVESKKIISYLPDHSYLDDNMVVEDIIETFKEFYSDFDTERANDMLSSLKIDPKSVMGSLSKGTKEKVQLILVMSRRAKLYILDEPIAGVDPAAREYILRTIIGNYDPSASILFSTHLITDVEKIIDEAIFLHDGTIKLHKSADDIRVEYGKSIDELFREVYRC